MKKKDVKIGGTYLTKVGGDLVRVWVTGEALGAYGTGGSHNGPSRFYCQRADNGQRLPKPRTAAALRPAKPSTGPGPVFAPDSAAWSGPRSAPYAGTRAQRVDTEAK